MSRIVLTGATGLVGGQVLKTAIADERISEIVVLSRRELPDKSLSENSKVTVVIHKDFQRYPPELITQLQGASAVIWCIGGMVRDFENVATARKVQVSYVKAAAEAFVEGGLLPLKWVFCSGAWAERDGEKKLWFIEETRKIKVCCRSLRSSLKFHIC
jgi:saccharopine dehydrogenase-like NADP-dependent oxidoreductase